MLDLTDVDAASGNPKGKYPMRILSAKDTKSQKGERMVKLEMCIVGPKHAGFKVFESAMLEGKGAPMGTAKLADLMDKIGIERKLDSMTPFLNKIVDADISEDKKSGYSKIGGYHKTAFVDEANSGENF